MVVIEEYFESTTQQQGPSEQVLTAMELSVLATWVKLKRLVKVVCFKVGLSRLVAKYQMVIQLGSVAARAAALTFIEQHVRELAIIDQIRVFAQLIWSRFFITAMV